MAGFNDWLEVTDPKLMAEALAEQFRLSQNEFQKAQQALAPAFALGLERAMADPKSWGDLASAFSAMMPGTGAVPASKASSVLDAFFGSDALTHAVARQASLFAGIAPDTIQKLMPSLAMLSMDTMMRATMANLARHQPEGLATGDFGGATAEMMRRGANAVEALTRPSDEPSRRRQERAAFGPAALGDAFQDAMRNSLSWMGRGMDGGMGSGTGPGTGWTTGDAAGRETGPPPRSAGPAPEMFNPMMPFAALFDAFAKGMQSAAGETAPEAPAQPPQPPAPEWPPRAEAAAPPAQAGPASAETPRPDPVPATDSLPGDGIVGEMMRSGQKIQEDYAREMASLFDRYQRAAPAP